VKVFVALTLCSLVACASNKPRPVVPVSDAPGSASSSACPELGQQEPQDESPECRAGNEDACEADCASSRAYGCFAMALVHEQNDDDQRAGKYYRRACQLGAPIACTNFGAQAFAGKGNVAPACALTLFESACATGEAFGCGMVGRVYAEGFGIAPDPARAQKVLDSSCKALGGFPCFALGLYLRKGTFGEADPDGARRAFERACATKYKPACAEAEGAASTKL